MYIDNTPLSLLFINLSNPSSLRFSLCNRYSNPLVDFADSVQYAMCVLYQEAKHWAQLSGCVSPVLTTGTGSPPSACWQCSV